MTSPVKLIYQPTVVPLAEMSIDPKGLAGLLSWVKDYRPECLPNASPEAGDLFPHDMTEDGRNLTGNELLVELAGRNCYDADTEILTETGWVSLPNLSEDTPIATYNRMSGQVEFQTPTDYIRKRYTGRMYNVRSRSVSLRVTEDHDIWHGDRHGWWNFATAAQVAGKEYRVRRTAPYPGLPFQEPTWKVPEGKEHAWATLMGYLLTEGYVFDGRGRGTGSRVTIYQRPEKSGPILACLADLGFSPRIQTDGRNGVLQITVGDTGLAQEVLSWASGLSHQKRVPSHVFHWPMGVRAALVDAMMAGDGTVCDGHRVFYTSSPGLADDMQLLLSLSGKPGSLNTVKRKADQTGFASRHPAYVVRECHRNEVVVNDKAHHDGWEDVVDEQVYCVTVPNRTLLIRRDGKVVVGANCYHSYGAKAGRKSNSDYVAHSQSGTVPHRSIMYHAKMTFFVAGISRRVSHELIRHYVGADRTEEGSPSQESTRYTHHPGHFIVPPRMLNAGPDAVQKFEADMEAGYGAYIRYISQEVEAWTDKHGGKPPVGMDRKRIYEAAAGELPMQAATSMIWTANPVSLAKMFMERTDESADAEFRRLALAWQDICLARWPNLFPKV